MYTRAYGLTVHTCAELPGSKTPGDPGNSEPSSTHRCECPRARKNSPPTKLGQRTQNCQKQRARRRGNDQQGMSRFSWHFRQLFCLLRTTNRRTLCLGTSITSTGVAASNVCMNSTTWFPNCSRSTRESARTARYRRCAPRCASEPPPAAAPQREVSAGRQARLRRRPY